MLAAAFRSVLPKQSPARCTHINLYTTVAELARTHWRTGAHPAPRSLARENEEDEDWPKPLTEGDEPAAAPASEEDGRPRSHRPFPTKPAFAPTPTEHRAHRAAMKRKCPDGWAPPRKLSREAMDALRDLHRHDPRMFSTPVLAERFRVSPEAVRRILRSKWEPTREQRVRMAAREQEARQRSRMESRERERRKYEEIQKEYGLVSDDREDDKFTLT